MNEPKLLASLLTIMDDLRVETYQAYPGLYEIYDYLENMYCYLIQKPYDDNYEAFIRDMGACMDCTYPEGCPVGLEECQTP